MRSGFFWCRRIWPWQMGRAIPNHQKIAAVAQEPSHSCSLAYDDGLCRVLVSPALSEGFSGYCNPRWKDANFASAPKLCAWLQERQQRPYMGHRKTISYCPTEWRTDFNISAIWRAPHIGWYRWTKPMARSMRQDIFNRARSHYLFGESSVAY